MLTSLDDCLWLKLLILVLLKKQAESLVQYP